MSRAFVSVPATSINGKFSAQPTTGVQRVARELTLALDALALRESVLLHPARATPPLLRHMQARPVGPRWLALHPWEQAALPWAARGGLLVNLAGAAPALAGRQLCLIHDAAVFDHPEAYTAAFTAWYRLLFRWLARRGARIATVSAFSRARLARHLGLDQHAIAVLPNGADHLGTVVADPAVLVRHALQPGGYLLAVGSANPTKNLAALVRAFARLDAGPALRLVIVGGSRPQVFARQAESDPPHVLRTGPLGDAPLKALYEGALGLAFPSLYEGFGLPPLEAMYCGCPVAAADAAAIPEVCGDAALYFDPRSEAAIADALARLASDGALRERLRAAGHTRSAGYTWRAAAERLALLIREAQAA